MPNQGAFGEELAGRFGFETAPAFVTQRLQETEIAVTQIRCETENNGLTSPFPLDDAFLVTIQLRDCPLHELWIHGRARQTAYLKNGTTSIYDLRTNPVVNSISPFHNVHFYLPRKTLAVIAEGDGINPFDDIETEPGIGIDDGVMRGLAQSLIPAFQRPAETNRIFVDHISIALAAHIARRFAPSVRPLEADPLSRAETDQAKETLDAHLDGDVSLRELADQAGMPIGRFQRGFVKTTGVPPHRWQLGRRVDRALDLIRNTRLTIDEIASFSGFADASHLDRVFLRSLGVTAAAIRGQDAVSTAAKRPI
jgi:AraC-like DNA-binding protein